jgi:uncharacterized membrane protein
MAITHESVDMFPLHRVPFTRPFIWLGRGWSDLMHNPLASLAYGWLIASLGALILAYSRHPLYIAAATVAFLLVGPVVTAGICELSRRRDHGEPTGFGDSLRGLTRARSSLWAFSGLLLLLAVGWFALSGLYLAATGGSVAPDIQSTVWGNVAAQLSAGQASTYAAAFIVLAGAVFAISVVSVPMIIDRHVDAATAIRMSLRATARDLPALLLWAVLIVGLVLFGFATWLLGMVVVLPLLGHATWHAYRDIVEEA